MAIKIIDETPDPSVVKKVICRKCGVKLEYLPIDVQSNTARDYSGESDTYYCIKCPKCQYSISVTSPGVY